MKLISLKSCLKNNLDFKHKLNLNDQSVRGKMLRRKSDLRRKLIKESKKESSLKKRKNKDQSKNALKKKKKNSSRRKKKKSLKGRDRLRKRIKENRLKKPKECKKKQRDLRKLKKIEYYLMLLWLELQVNLSFNMLKMKLQTNSRIKRIKLIRNCTTRFNNKNQTKKEWSESFNSNKKKRMRGEWR